MKGIIIPEKFKEKLEEHFTQKNIYLIDWTFVSHINSLIFLIGDFSKDENFIPEQVGIEVSIIKPIYVLYRVNERRKKNFQYKNISIYGFPPPNIKEINNAKLVEKISSIIKINAPNYVQVELSFALENKEFFSDINFKYYGKNF